MGFRFTAKNLFVTYPRSPNLTKERIRDFFNELGATTYTISRELHEDGVAHHHGLIQWANVFDTRNERAFDIDGHHPNIQTARNIRHVRDYVRKAGDCISSCEMENGPRRYADLLGCDSREAYWELARREYPRDVVLHAERLEYCAEKLFGRSNEEYVSTFTSYKPPENLVEWTEEELTNNGEVRLLAFARGRGTTVPLDHPL